MIRSIRERMNDEGGFTLVEVMAALIVLAVAMTGLAGAMIGGLRATQATQFRSAAMELAKDRLEALRSVDWKYLGHYKDEAAWDTGFHDGESLVSVAAATPSPRPANVPYLTPETVTVNGVDYSVATHVTWVGSSTSTPNDGSTYAQKRISVDVSYTFRGTAQTVHLEGLRAPNAREMKPASSSAAVAINISNATVGLDQTLDASGMTTSELTLLADTSVIGESVTAVYTLSSGETVSVDLTADATGKHWVATIPAGEGPFDAGTATFTFSAQHSSGTSSTATDTVTFSAPAVLFALSGASVTISNAQLISGYFTQASIELSVTTTSTASGVQVTYPLQGGGTSSPVNLSYNGTAWVGSIASGAGPMTPGNTTFTFSGTSVGGGTASATASLTLAEPTLGAISILKPTVSPAFDVNNSTGKLANATVVTVEILNVDATGNSVTIKVGSLAVQNATALGTVGPSGGQLFKITVAKNAALGTSSPTSVVTNVTRAADGATANATYTFPGGVMNLLRQRLRHSRGSGGFSLIELLVVVTLLTVVGGIVLSAIMTATRVQRKNDSIVLQRTAAQTALERMGRDFTVADPLVAAGANDATMRVYRDGACEVHRWYVNGSNDLALDVSSYAASTTCTNVTGSPSSAVTTIVAEDVANGSTPALHATRSGTLHRRRAPRSLRRSPAASVRTVDRVEIELG